MSFSDVDVFVAIRQDQTTYSKIRSTALDLFVKHGYEEVGLRQIAQAIGIQPGSLYNHIDGKEGLLFSLIFEYDVALIGHLKKSVEPSTLPRDKLEQYVYTYICYGVLNHDLHLLASRERMYLAGVYGERIQSSKNAMSDLLDRIIDDGAALGEFCSKEELLAVIAIESVLNGFVASISGDRQEHWEALSKLACGIVLKMVNK